MFETRQLFKRRVSIEGPAFLLVFACRLPSGLSPVIDAEGVGVD